MKPIYQNYNLDMHETVRFLLPEGRAECGSLSYRFTVQSLDKAVHYAALSYVWGDSRCCGTIIIESVLYKVTRNLLAALQRIDTIIHSKIELSNPVLVSLWADQICINQSNKDERASQVSMMKSIYSRAGCVFSFLGESDAAAEVASLVNQVACQIEEDVARYQGLIKIPKVSIKELASLNRLNWTAFRDMLLLPYFSRVWIIQEIGVSRRGLVLYGDHQFALDRLMLILAWLSEPGYRIRQLYDISGWTTHRIWASFDMKKRDDTESFPPLDFLDLLSNTSYKYKATDPRDHIFGLLGHPSVGLRPPGEGELQSLIITPDYRGSMEKVFLDFAISWLKHTAKPYLFSCISHLTLPPAFEEGRSSGCVRNLDLPSWCPSWNYNPTGGTRLSVERERQWYAASADSQFRFQIQPPNRLEVKGILYDAIIKTFPTLDELIIPIGRQVVSNTLNLTIQEISDAQKLSYLCGKVLQSATKRCAANVEDVMFNFAATALRGSWECSDVSVDRVAQLANIKALLSDAKRGGVPATQDDFTPALDILESCCAHMSNIHPTNTSSSFTINAGLAMTSRRLCLTKSGCIGLGPAVMSPGDICCIVSGANIPYAIRPFNQHTFLMVGECYIQSIMHGEAVTKIDEQSTPWHDIILE
ncbi:hypothetical protein AA0119_g654 [Alternaria tenuissima]|uniref:Heterokaryon incompatibility domain-containing protein n=2 Tax=Alternaria alternata complex TaxID=187734 RepID=A0A4Q4NBW5_ALTAL|nr:hypothetical protein AA0115_g865 [Alternaria tenuissima]RYN72785.1 hypothetical protein AA0117_g8293 [Alternaria alternata]RYO09633.1 hypothetical protein AA0119_g654 [Alternaria tenuissima]RYO11897.1 hypothetical protein AA0121_g9615 [Alternaria tenuissima]RYO53636.1 hypothetical protein AA0116_g10691 [Alternaria tenuissima]